jgi:hypothetical protein
MRNSYCIKKKKPKGRQTSSVIATKVTIQTYLRITLLDSRLHGNDTERISVIGQSFTEFIIIFPVLLLMLSSVLFFARLLVLKQRTVSAVRYVAWYAGRHDGNEPSANALKALFFNKNSTLLISHPDPKIGFAGNSLGDLVDVLGKVAGIQGTAIDVTGCNYPFSSKIAHTGAQHFVFMDTWKESGITGKALKYGLWAIAVAKGFKNGSGSSSGNGGNTSIDLENPSIFGN